MLDPLIDTLHAYLSAGNVDWKHVILTGMTPVFLIAFVIEWAKLRNTDKAKQFSGPDILANLGLGASYQVFEIAAYALITAVAANWIYQYRIYDMPINGWTILPLFLLEEFLYYWFHRSSHRVRWFWSAHVVHHSGEHMNMTTAMRQSLLYSITGWWLFFMPMVWLGVPPAVVFALYGCNLAYQYFIHTESVGKLPRWVEYIFDTPAAHRAHHGRNPQYVDKNYGGVLIIFDRLFGTYVEENEAVDYGLAYRQPEGHNILTLNFQEFNAMWRDVLKPGPLSQRLKHLWGPPEWQRPSSE
ncbi:sterol desaturase family protein [Spongiibacter sp. KMU-158]|uniref:Sterol desaturase family protein n=1 Tax=Spongiibacter pelagi TaxID=2760804 RepID=A0A927GVP6_9GAMM|nr:sterol desaturase family protein [Spongiibacter pelagi]MBD2858107.1 sterol desaturase family protein [Spongiibacter pelagi]